MDDAHDKLMGFAMGPWSFLRSDQPMFMVLNERPNFFERFKDLKSDDLAKIAPWAIFGDSPKKSRSRRRS